MSTKWSYNNTSGGYWSNDNFDTRKEAIEAGREEYPSEDFYVGQCNPIDFIPYLYIDAEHAIDALSGQIDDNYGGNDLEFGQSFYDEAMEQHDSLQAKLDKAVKEWLSENEFCKECFTICGTELIKAKE